MILRILARLLTLVTLTYSLVSEAYGQHDVSTLWVNVSDDCIPPDTLLMVFANTPGASYGSECIGAYYCEFISPPPTVGLDAAWTGFRPPAGNPSFGGWPLDIRGIPANPTVKDTFQLSVNATAQPQESSNVSLVWPDRGCILNRCDSLTLVPKTSGLLDIDGNPLPSRIDMREVRRLDLLKPFLNTSSNVFRFQVYRYGVKLIDDLDSPWWITDARELAADIPVAFSLQQNYPNPFNLETRISYLVPRATPVSLAINDVLGKEVARLVNENKQPGDYSVNWNASGIPSGVHFYSLVAGGIVATKKMVLMR